MNIFTISYKKDMNNSNQDCVKDVDYHCDDHDNDLIKIIKNAHISAPVPLTLEVPESNINEMSYEDFDTWPYMYHFSYNESNAFSTIENLDIKDIKTVGLDIDQTIGDVGKASVLYNLHMHFHKKPPPYERVNWFFENGAFRPYLKEFIRYLVFLRDNHKISKIIIVTAINNYNGYVNWLCTCLEHYCNVDNLIDEIRDSSTATKFTSDGRTIKELGPTEILIDDRPQNIEPSSRAIEISEYYCKVDASQYIDYFVNNDKVIVNKTLIRDAVNDSSVTFAEASQDNELEKILNSLREKFE